TGSRGRPERTASEARRACRDCLAPMGLKGLAARQVKTGRQAPLVLTAMMVRPRTRWQSLQGSSARKPNGSTPSWEKRALGVLLALMVPTELKVPEVRVARKASRVCRVKLAQQALTASPDLRVSLVLPVSADPLARRVLRDPRVAPVLLGLLARMEPRATRVIQGIAVPLDLRALRVRMQSSLSERRISPQESLIAPASSTSPRSSTRQTLW